MIRHLIRASKDGYCTDSHDNVHYLTSATTTGKHDGTFETKYTCHFCRELVVQTKNAPTEVAKHIRKAAA